LTVAFLRVHPLDLTVRPGMSWLGQPVIVIVQGAGIIEGVRAEGLPIGGHLPDFRSAPAFAGGIGQMGPVVGEDRVDPVGDGLDQAAQELRSGTALDLMCPACQWSRQLPGALRFDPGLRNFAPHALLASPAA
jgi:hypothetical protein